jgi:hypothetical protein
MFNDPKIGWDGSYNGKLAPDGVYTWTIRMKDYENDKKYTFSGHLNVLK